MDCKKIRSDFPILKNIVYLDSAATSLTPEPVISAMVEYYRSCRANIGRGVYRTSQMADMMYRMAHQKIASFIGADDGSLILTRNTTEAINIAARGIEWQRGDRIVTTIAEHHSNLLPWLRLRRFGVEVELAWPDRNAAMDLSVLENAIDDKTRLVAVSHVTNALGSINPIHEISEICRDHGSLLLIDAAQSVPHMPMNVFDIGCDLLAFSGHKMLGPTGTGGLYISSELMPEVEPLMLGGGMVEDVNLEGYTAKGGYEGFLAGTPDIAGCIGLGAAVDYLQRVGPEEIAGHEIALTRKLLEGLYDIEGVEVYGSPNTTKRGGIVSFNVTGMHPHDVALMLDEASNIMVRSGLHCCIPLMRFLDLDGGTVRASLYLYNVEEDVELLLETVRSIARAL